VREFKGVEGWVRKHFIIYKVIRKSAPFLCRFITLEEGFDFLGYIKPLSSSFFALDIGANDGTSIRMIQQYLPEVKIVAFDPVTKPNFDISSIDFRDYALGAKPGGFEIHTPTVKGYRLTQYSSFEREKLINQITHDLGITEKEVSIESKFVRVTDLDSLELTPFFIKIDVEGFELEVLEGAKETIGAHLPIILIEIQSRATFQKVQSYLGNLGYISVFVDPKSNLTSAKFEENLCDSYNPRFNNYVWVSRSTSPTWAFNA
jgi:FkbM family methyltransferase